MPPSFYAKSAAKSMVFDEQLRSGAITEPRAVASGIKTQRAKEMSLESFSIAPTADLAFLSRLLQLAVL
ncbi:MAG: hypothetical protein AUJ04_06045 [Acidobacteria bacterium 13_1_40CM_3_55_6]|nr:MAG: hypothetical protein AUJ04_06045 [Acidobacteria bacterium 13_1_40CM_3_55_6]